MSEPMSDKELRDLRNLACRDNDLELHMALDEIDRLRAENERLKNPKLQESLDKLA